MQNSALLVVLLILSFSVGVSSQEIYAQLQPKTDLSSNSTSTNRNTVVSVNSSVTVRVSNDTDKAQQGTLRSAVLNFLNSGPSALKTSDTSEIKSKTTIANRITDATQNVEGTDAMNAIIVVELGNAIKALTISSNQSVQESVITLVTSSKCKPSAVNLIVCDNSVTIK